eukprot:TRINITY_DN2510_c0_g1_i3.p1 TRINITY_DN2510_c0_g1~~TRINITY_DN2510_c0_g1_i3.p1  ORF type:complete len:487 (-),score=45.07 TRINITY_DN2510_c0_g1_i3:113-1573(-)
MTKASRRRTSLAAILGKELRDGARQDVPVFAVDIPGFRLNPLGQESPVASCDQPVALTGVRLGALGLAIGMALHDCFCGENAYVPTQKRPHSSSASEAVVSAPTVGFGAGSASAECDGVVQWDDDDDVLRCQWICQPGMRRQAAQIGRQKSKTVHDDVESDCTEDDRDPPTHKDDIPNWEAGLSSEALARSAEATAAAMRARSPRASSPDVSRLAKTASDDLSDVNLGCSRATRRPSPLAETRQSASFENLEESISPSQSLRRPFSVTSRHLDASVAEQCFSARSRDYVVMWRNASPLSSPSQGAARKEVSTPSGRKGSKSLALLNDAPLPETPTQSRMMFQRNCPPMLLAAELLALEAKEQHRRATQKPVFPELGRRGHKGLPPTMPGSPSSPSLRRSPTAPGGVLRQAALQGLEDRPSLARTVSANSLSRSWSTAGAGSTGAREFALPRSWSQVAPSGGVYYLPPQLPGTPMGAYASCRMGVTP